MEAQWWDFVLQQAPIIVFLTIAIWAFLTDRVVSGKRHQAEMERAEQTIQRLVQERDRFLEALLKSEDAVSRSAEIARLTAEAVREVLMEKDK